jgi:hypothetical protein
MLFVFFVVRVLTFLSGFFHLDGAHFVFRYLCRRIMGRIGEHIGARFSKMVMNTTPTSTLSVRVTFATISPRREATFTIQPLYTLTPGKSNRKLQLLLPN